MKPLEKEPLTSARHEARIDRLALSEMPTLWERLVDTYGRPMSVVRDLSPERDIRDFPRLSQLKWVGGGRWADLGSGAQGDGVIALVVWLSAGAPRERCVEFLEQALAELDANAA